MLKQLLAVVPVTGRRLRATESGFSKWLFPVEQLHVGDRLEVRPGERMPLDGIIVKGATAVTSSALGLNEALVERSEGQRVYCGTLNCGETIEIQVTSEFEASSLQRLIKEAQANNRSLLGKILDSFMPAQGVALR